MASVFVRLPKATTINLAVAGADGSIQFSDGAGELDSDPNNLFWDDTNNRLGIGTNTPGSPIEVSTGNDYGLIQTNGTVSVGTFVDGGLGYFGTQSNHGIGFFVNGGDSSLLVAADGNVSIGTGNNDPTSRLIVKGTTTDNTASSLQIHNSDNDPLLYVQNDGKIGVSTEMPTYQLTVNKSNDYGLVHTDGTVDLGTFVDGTVGYIGTATNHDFAVFTNNGGAQLTVKTTGDTEISTNGAKLSVGGPTPGATIDAKTAVADTAIRITQAENGKHVSFKLPTLSENTTYTLPAADGSSGQFQVTDGSGVLSFTYDIVTPNHATAPSDVNITTGAITGGEGGGPNSAGSFVVAAGATNSTDPLSGGGDITITAGAQTVSQTGTPGDGEGGGKIIISAGNGKNQFGGTARLAGGDSEWQGGDVYIAAGGGLIDDDGWGGSAIIYGGSVTGGTAQAGHIDFNPGVNPESDALSGKIRCNGVFKLYSLEADPSTGENGDMYYNTTTNKFRGFANGVWVDLN